MAKNDLEHQIKEIAAKAKDYGIKFRGSLMEIGLKEADFVLFKKGDSKKDIEVKFLDDGTLEISLNKCS